jgi:hypothetical protein
MPVVMERHGMLPPGQPGEWYRNGDKRQVRQPSRGMLSDYRG